MTFHDAIQTCLKKYATLRGRASRSEFWWFNLFFLGTNILFLLCLGKGVGGAGLLIAFCVFNLALLLPGISVAVRRLHDTGRSGWWVLANTACNALANLSPEELKTAAGLASIGVSLVLLYFFCQRGAAGANQYGFPTGEGLTSDQPTTANEETAWDNFSSHNENATHADSSDSQAKPQDWYDGRLAGEVENVRYGHTSGSTYAETTAQAVGTAASTSSDIASSDTPLCPACGAVMESNDRFCRYCGQRICSACRAAVKAEDASCSACGRSLR